MIDLLEILLPIILKLLPAKEWLKKYGNGISDIFDKSEMSNLRTLVSAKNV
jgi:hypothetical protein